MRRPVAVVIVCVLIVGFVFGLMWILNLRLAKGDTYPPLSTLRTDPLGAKVLYESLANLPGFTVERSYRRLGAIHADGATVFFFDLYPGEAANRTIDALATSGGRVVIAFRPLAAAPVREEPDKKTKTVTSFEDLPSIGVKIAFCEAAQGPRTRARPRNSVVYFGKSDAAWRVLKEGPCGPTSMQRSFGRGSMVLIANPFPFSNEAMATKPALDFLIGVLGPNRRVIFDESHFGMHENPGVALLARQYHLQGVALALIVLAGLFIWRQSALFPPVPDDSTDEAEVKGREAAAGLGRLLRRAVPPRDVVAACVEEWHKAHAPAHASPEEVDEALRIARRLATSADPVRAYREIASILNRT